MGPEWSLWEHLLKQVSTMKFVCLKQPFEIYPIGSFHEGYTALQNTHRLKLIKQALMPNLVKCFWYIYEDWPYFKRWITIKRFKNFVVFLNWDSFHARLNSHYEEWSHKKKKHKKINAYRKSVYKEPRVKRCLLILALKPLRSQVKGKHSIGRGFQSLAVRGKKLLTWTSL